MPGLLVLAIIALILLVIVAAIIRTIIGLVLALAVAILAGVIAREVVGGRKSNILELLLVGLVGALVGTILARIAGFPRLISVGGLPILWTIVGAIIVAVVWNAISARNARTAV
jgi:uncharacterized membrane protein YeaQ/YmgE (transglycosylase-associated protein family)